MRAPSARGGPPATLPSPRASRGALRAWLAVAACIGVIFLFSSDEFSAGSTGRIIGPLLRWLFPDLSPAALIALHIWVRKAAHVIEYAALGLLSFHALRLSLAASFAHVSLASLAIVLAVAATDELRQSFLASRTGSIVDVGIDLVGGAIGVCLFVALHRIAGVGAPGPETPGG